MNRIVKRNLPVSELPEGWRAGLPAEGRVRVVIEVESEKPRDAIEPISLSEILARRNDATKPA